jgi:hypothetical protein
MYAMILSNLDPTMDVYELMEILGLILRPFGALAFGLGAGWLAVQAVNMKVWQFAVAAALGVSAVFVLIASWLDSPGTLGGFGLGVGMAVVLWGIGRVRVGDTKK